MRKTLCMTVVATLALAACNDSSSGGGGGGSSSGGSSSGGSSGGSGSSALSSFVLNLFAMDTTETATPVDLASVMLDTSSEDPTAYASLFAPGG